MSALEDLPAARAAVRLRHQRELVTLDQRRALLELVAAGASQRDFAVLLGVAQPTVDALLQRAEGTPQPWRASPVRRRWRSPSATPPA